MMEKAVMESKKIYLVEVVTIFRNSFAVEADSAEQAEFYSLSGVADEFSQKHLTDEVYRSREISEDEYLEIFDRDNDYLRDWNREQKLRYVSRA
jgi:hypothetical protein